MMGAMVKPAPQRPNQTGLAAKTSMRWNISIPSKF